MQRFDPLAGSRQSPFAAFGPGEAGNPSPASDDGGIGCGQDSPDDGSRLVECLQRWAAQLPAAGSAGPTLGSHPGFHYLWRGRAADLPGRATIGAVLAAKEHPLPAAWAGRLLDGWPPPVSGLHRIELATGGCWISLALDLTPAARRRLAAEAAGWGSRSRYRPANEAIVIGAGLAGCALADALTRRGRQVTVLEAGASPGGVVSEIPLLAQHPALSPGRDPRSRLLIAALLASVRLRKRLGDAWHWCGRFQPMPIDEARRRCEEIPAALAEAVACSQAATHGLAGQSGVWFDQCALADPRQWWQQVQADPGVDVRLAKRVAHIRRQDGRWFAYDDAQRVIASAPVVILANQAGAFELAGMDEDATGALRRSLLQVAIGTGRDDGLDAGRPPARPILGGSSYRLEHPGVSCVVGPIRQADAASGAASAEEDPATSIPGAITSARDIGYRWRRSAPAERLLLRDNLPMIGAVPAVQAILAQRDRFERNDRLPLPRRDDLYLMTGLGGRGLLWSVLGAEIIAAAIDHEPAVVEANLLAAVDPARFLKRMLQRTRRTC